MQCQNYLLWTTSCSIYVVTAYLKFYGTCICMVQYFPFLDWINVLQLTFIICRALEMLLLSLCIISYTIHRPSSIRLWFWKYCISRAQVPCTNHSGCCYILPQDHVQLYMEHNMACISFYNQKQMRMLKLLPQEKYKILNCLLQQSC